MCQPLKKRINPNFLYLAALFLGLLAGYFQQPRIIQLAELSSQVFVNLLKLVSLPIIFLSILSTASGMENVDQIKKLGKKVVKYTLLTTVIAAAVALTLFILIDPVREVVVSSQIEQANATEDKGYLSFFINIIPSNLVQPFYENNVIGVLFLSILFSLAVVSLPPNHRSVLHQFFVALYQAVIQITKWVIFLMPIAVFAFITLFMRDIQLGLEIKSLALYLVCVILANLIQACIVLPTLLKMKGRSPIAVFKAMMPALSLAFFTKSSAAALPLAMRCAEENAGVSRRVASFTLPLCITINMNACAAFILITVLFVSMSNGMVYSFPEMVLWIILSTIAAIGNAGVPMGCYFLASAFLAAMNVPLNILGIILPFYTLIDMLESAINVWSDSCVAVSVQEDVQREEQKIALLNEELS